MLPQQQIAQQKNRVQQKQLIHDQQLACQERIAHQFKDSQLDDTVIIRKPQVAPGTLNDEMDKWLITRLIFSRNIRGMTENLLQNYNSKKHTFGSGDNKENTRFLIAALESFQYHNEKGRLYNALFLLCDKEIMGLNDLLDEYFPLLHKEMTDEQLQEATTAAMAHLKSFEQQATDNDEPQPEQ